MHSRTAVAQGNGGGLPRGGVIPLDAFNAASGGGLTLPPAVRIGSAPEALPCITGLRCIGTGAGVGAGAPLAFLRSTV